ncbi:MAG: transferase, partial [Gaiellaceae bacterium]
YDPWLRTHERLGAEVLGPAERSLTVAGTRAEWEEWTELQFPEDGDYVVPGALAPVRFEGGRGVYVEPGVWMVHRAD